MNILIKLKKKSENPNSEKLVKYYLLDCCEKLIRFRSSSCLSNNIPLARKFIKGFATQKKIHQAEWEQEGEAFGVEYYSSIEKDTPFYFRAKKEISSDLVKVRISKGLNNKESRKHLSDMAYFIDGVFCHIAFTSNWLFSEQSEQFLCPMLYTKYFDATA